MAVNRILKAVAWLHWKDEKTLCVRSKGKDKFYIPGGKYEAGESDEGALVREIREELGVTLSPGSIREKMTVRAPAHGFLEPTTVEMKCFEAEYTGVLRAHSEIAELAWLSFEERSRCAPAARLAIEYLYNSGNFLGEPL